MESVSGPWPAMSGNGVAALGVQQQEHVQSGLETAYCKHAQCSFSVYSMRDLRNPPFLFHIYLFVHACFIAYMWKSENKFLGLVFSLLPCRFLGSNLESQTQWQILLPS